MNNLFKTSLFILVLLLSCSRNKKKQYDPNVNLDGVSLDEVRSQNKNKLTIEKNGEVFGPKSDNPEENNLENKKNSLRAVVFGPGVNRVVGHVVTIKELKERKINVHYVLGLGMGAIVAAHFAKGLSAEVIEWKMFKLFQKLENEKTFSLPWSRIIREYIFKEFSGEEVQSTQKVFLVQVFNPLTKKVNYISKGSLVGTLLKTVFFSERSPLLYEGYNAQVFNKLEVDEVFVSDVISGGITFSNKNLKNDEFKKIYERSLVELKTFKNILRLPFSNVPLDSQKNIPTSLINAKKYLKEYMNQYSNENDDERVN